MCKSIKRLLVVLLILIQIVIMVSGCGKEKLDETNNKGGNEEILLQIMKHKIIQKEKHLQLHYRHIVI